MNGFSNDHEMASYKEIRFRAPIEGVLDRIFGAMINIVAVNITHDINRIVVANGDLQRTVALIGGPVCVSDVTIYTILPHPGFLRAIMRGPSSDPRQIAAVYMGEKNQVVFRFQGPCD